MPSPFSVYRGHIMQRNPGVARVKRWIVTDATGGDLTWYDTKAEAVARAAREREAAR